MMAESEPDPSMYGALPPGAWWEVANGSKPVIQPYGDDAGDAAVQVADQGVAHSSCNATLRLHSALWTPPHLS